MFYNNTASLSYSDSERRTNNHNLTVKQSDKIESLQKTGTEIYPW